MKNLYIKTVLINIILFALISCKAQQILPLNAGWYKSPTGSYFKDLNNELDQFVGVWKANYTDKTITLIVSKQLKQPFSMVDKSFYKDELNVRYEIKNNSGLIFHSTMNQNFSLNPHFGFISVASRPSLNEVTLVYNGGRCSIGLGTVYFKKINSTQIQWNYKPQPATLNSISCPPPYDNDKIYLPIIQDLIFTKQ